MKKDAIKPQNLRVGLIGPVPPPAGGMANQTRQLKELLEREGVAVTLVPVNPPYRPAWIGEIRGLRAAFRIIPYLASLWRCAGQVSLFHVMANSGWAWHLFAAPAVWIARLRGIPAIVNYRGGEAQAFLARSRRWVLPTLLRASAVAVPSGFLRDVFAPFGVRARVVPNVVDLARFCPAVVPPDDGAPRVVVARNLEPIYDVATAICAFASVRRAVPGARMTIAGSGPERPRLETLARQLGIAEAVAFAGRQDRDGMAELYRCASVMVNSSLVDNMPNSVLEALASGVPVVSTRVGGVPYLVEDGATALLVPPGDADALAAAVLRMLQEPSLADSLRQAGLREVQQYAWQSVRLRLFDLYADALGAGSGERGAGSGERGAGSGERGAGSELVGCGEERTASFAIRCGSLRSPHPTTGDVGANSFAQDGYPSLSGGSPELTAHRLPPRSP
ncbi:MAG: glycosyltransferase family 4 protein [Sulfuricella sp.]|nr:glycosyltransferase family 4 protein [Sulfuricella sp.]